MIVIVCDCDCVSVCLCVIVSDDEFRHIFVSLESSPVLNGRQCCSIHAVVQVAVYILAEEHDFLDSRFNERIHLLPPTGMLSH